jgi:hypothetical protein
VVERGRAKATVFGTVALAAAVVAGRRARRTLRVRALARRLDTTDVGARIGAAIALVDEGLGVSAPDLLLLVRTDHNPAVLDAVANAVREAPPVAHPSASLRELLQWSDAELGTRFAAR